MATSSRLILFSTLVSLISFYLSSTLGDQNTLQTYIIHVSLPTSEVNLESYYRSFLPVDDDLTPSSQSIHSYRHVISGFAARLTHDELQEMEKKEGFITTKPQKMLAFHTTHTPNFLGLQQNGGVWQESNYGKDVIIGLWDSGITPDHPSFHDNNMPPLSAKWKGKCEFTGSVTCNNKLSVQGTYWAVAQVIHHLIIRAMELTSSTSTGNFVDRVNIFGNANGTSAGMAPFAHIAMYKVCTEGGCEEDDMWLRLKLPFMMV
ncbi:hypothetical protein BC332_16206 [Capsicum chinense]|nr:hypothetical protein BC332_16206 [Capsicum chinense]